MRSMTFLHVDRCSNAPFSTLRILRILQIDIAYIAYFTDRHFGIFILRVLRILQIDFGSYCVYCVILRCVFYNKPFQGT